MNSGWHKRKPHSDPHSDVDVFVFGVENRAEATAWLGSVRTKQVPPGWKVSTYQIGDEGYLSQYKNGERFEIEFRKGSVVAKIAGKHLLTVKDFAKCIVDEIPANYNSR